MRKFILQSSAFSLLFLSLSLAAAPQVPRIAWAVETSTKAAYKIYDTASGTVPKNITLTLIDEQTDPTEQIKFDLGNRSFTIPETWHGYDYRRDVDADHYELYNYRKYDHSIVVTHFVVVVEWKWKHFGDTAFVPDENVPDWLNHRL